MLNSQLNITRQIIFVILIIVIPFVSFLVFSAYQEKQNELKIYGKTTKDAAGKIIYHTIPEWRFINQEGVEVTEQEMQGKVYVANFFFAVCPSICPMMTSQMYRVQEKFLEDDRVKLISHSVDPVRDSVPVLQDYADRNGVVATKWSLVTGDKMEIYKIARNGYQILAMEGDGSPIGFIHSEMLVLVDDNRRIRGYYDGTNAKEVDKLLMHIDKLLLEIEKTK